MPHAAFELRAGRLARSSKRFLARGGSQCGRCPDRRPGDARKHPLFILLDGTWPEARKMLRKSAGLDRLPVLGLKPEQLSRYTLRRSRRDDHHCTSEVAALCLNLADEHAAAQPLEACLAVFTHHRLQARNQWPIAGDGAAHQRLRELSDSKPLALAEEA